MKQQLKTTLLVTGLLALNSFLGACASITAMQGAETLKAGEIKKVVGVGYSNLKLNADEGESLNVPGVDAMVRYGITDQDEVGARIANLGTFGVVDYKRSLIDAGQMYLSVGAGLGGTSITYGDTSKSTIVDFYLPLYFDYKINDDITLITSPKYIFRSGFNTDVNQQTSTSTSSQVGLSGGVKMGKEKGVILEAAYTKQLQDTKEGYWQVMGSFFFP